MPRNPSVGYHTITPQIMSSVARRTLEFVESVFGATVLRLYEDGGLIVHSELAVGDSRIMVAQADDEFGDFPAMLNVYGDDVDATFVRALEGAASPLREREDQFYGDRTAGVIDDQGNQWWISTRIEDVPQAEIGRRMTELTG